MPFTSTGPGGVHLVDREPLGPAVHLAGRGEHDAGAGRDPPQRLEERELAADVEVEVAQRVGHAGVVAHLAGDVEHDVGAVDDSATGRSPRSATRISAPAAPSRLRGVAAVLGDQRVDHTAPRRPAASEGVHEVRSDEAEASGDHASHPGEAARARVDRERYMGATLLSAPPGRAERRSYHRHPWDAARLRSVPAC